ncbi:MAG: pantetheine-phosphate adenylyltransferase [Myxococcota bacterium]
MSEKLAVCPGSFDPPTNGHIDIIERALRLFDRVIIAVTVNVSKRPMFTLDERMDLIRACFPDESRVVIESLDGLLATYANQRGAIALVKGLRAPSDFEYELQMAQMNHHLTPELETVFLAADAIGSYVSSSLVKEVASLGGDVDALVPPPVAAALARRLKH